MLELPEERKTPTLAWDAVMTESPYVMFPTPQYLLNEVHSAGFGGIVKCIGLYVDRTEVFLILPQYLFQFC